MRILHIIPYFVPAYGFGGPIAVCHDLAACQAADGHNVTVVTTDVLDANHRIAEREETMDGILVIRFPNVSSWLAKRLNLYTPRGIKKWAAANVGQYDIIHLHDFFTYQNIVFAAQARLQGVPYFVHPHGAAPVEGQRLMVAKRVFNRLYGERIMQEAAGVIAISEAERQRIVRDFPGTDKRLTCVPNGVALPERVAAPAGLRERYGFTGAAKIILTMSRLYSIKGIDLLIRAVAELHRRDRQYRLLIAGGDDGSLASLQAQVAECGLQESVTFLGLVRGEKKAEAFMLADVFASFSRYDAFGLVVVEGMGYGLPVCLSSQVAIAREVTNKGCGVLLTDAEDAALSADQLSQAYEGRKEYGKRSRVVAAEYGIEVMARRVIDLYRAALAESAA